MQKTSTKQIEFRYENLDGDVSDVIMGQEIVLVENVSASTYVSIVKIDGKLHLHYISDEVNYNLPLDKVSEIAETLNNVNVNAKLFLFNLDRFGTDGLKIDKARKINEYLTRYLIKNDLNYKNYWSSIKIFFKDLKNVFNK